MNKNLQFTITLITLLLISCAGDVSSQTSFESSSSNTYTVAFDSRGGSIAPNQIVEPNSFISPPNVSKEGHNLEGWYTSQNGGVSLENKWNFFTDRVNFNFTLYASWTINQYTLTFESNGGSIVPSITSNYGDNLNILTPTKEVHSFGGWFTDVGLTQAFTLTTMPASNLTLYAKWTINQYTITFETNGGTSIASITGNYGDAVSVPSNPTREDNTFNGWYADANLTQTATVPNAIPAQNLTFYAGWTTDGIQQISLGSNHSSALSSHGRVFMWGYNYDGQSGDGTTTIRNVPTEITSRFSLATGDKIILLSLGEGHSSALSSYGRVFMWGYNDNGQLGNGSTTNIVTPTEITSAISLTASDKIISLSLGSNHSSALSSHGRVFMWGSGFQGKLASGWNISFTFPIEISVIYYD